MCVCVCVSVCIEQMRVVVPDGAVDATFLPHPPHPPHHCGQPINDWLFYFFFRNAWGTIEV